MKKGLNDLVVETQQELDILEMMIEGLLNENQIDTVYLDGDSVLQSVDSLINQAYLLEEQKKARAEKDIPNIEEKIKRYQKEFDNLRKKKLELNRQSMNISTLDVPAIMNEIRLKRPKILKDVLVSTANLISKMPAVTEEQVDKAFKLALKHRCKLAVSEFIDSYA
ncbi:hypothetical protein M9Y10_012837 [Tritrichomonas musculus]|uniref:Uncharacterized protein n=1 Tax=Tritrichomonas musculus TaxID=1915356 RepID=A0ABR2IEA2_9EUKA